jgi:hypothetical protein
MPKTLISIRVDDDVLAWFREQYAGSGGYQSAINRVLRAHIDREKTDAAIEVYSENRITLADLRRVVREELEQQSRVADSTAEQMSHAKKVQEE